MKQITTAMFLASCLVFSGQAQAQTAADFLKSLEGDYSGRGNARFIGDKSQRIACKVSSVFDESASKLVVTGECAGTQGKGTISGAITAMNDQLDGSFVSPRKGMTVTQSSGQLEGETMQLSTSMVDENAGRLVRIRQVISKTEEGIDAQFFTFDNGTNSYQPSGEIQLNRAGETASE